MFGEFFSSVTNRVMSAALLAAIILAVLMGFAIRSLNAKNADLRADKSALTAQVTTLNTNLEAMQRSAIERADDDRAIAVGQKELTDAIKQIPDTRPAAVRVALGCQRLRRAGRLDADLPAACRLGGGSKAQPQP